MREAPVSSAADMRRSGECSALSSSAIWPNCGGAESKRESGKLKERKGILEVMTVPQIILGCWSDNGIFPHAFISGLPSFFLPLPPQIQL